MDFVQIYTLAMLVIYIIIGLHKHEDIEEVEHDFRKTFLGLLVALPYVGRVFNWW